MTKFTTNKKKRKGKKKKTTLKSKKKKKKKKICFKNTVNPVQQQSLYCSEYPEDKEEEVTIAHDLRLSGAFRQKRIKGHSKQKDEQKDKKKEYIIISQ